ncbi:glycoside hydrolase family 88 protein [Bacteroidota bacterium]
MKINFDISIADLSNKLETFWDLATEKAIKLDKEYDPSIGSPVFTAEGIYTTRGWTEWTQGFQYGIPLLVFDVTGSPKMLEIGKRNTFTNMAHHLSHFGVHDHGFNNLSTYGNLLRNANLLKFKASEEEKEFYKLAISVSGAVQARRWSEVKDGGFIYSFNGPHSLFIDTIRTCRILLAAYKLVHRMLEEGDREIDLLERAIVHGMTTAKYAIFYGEGRDSYDVWGRTAHESVFNVNDGNYRCPNSQQGFSGFTTWTRGLAWAMLGYPEFLEFLEEVNPATEGIEEIKEAFLKAARATNDFFIKNTALDGIPYWDTGAPLIHKLVEYREKSSDPFNEFEPVDSSAAAIGAQGLIRLGKYLEKIDPETSTKYYQAGLTVLDTLLSQPYLSTDEKHQGILLHSVYHRPNGWDHIPSGAKVPCGESSMWGDYHMTELCLTAQRIMEGDHYTFFKDL